MFPIKGRGLLIRGLHYSVKGSISIRFMLAYGQPRASLQLASGYAPSCRVTRRISRVKFVDCIERETLHTTPYTAQSKIRA